MIIKRQRPHRGHMTRKRTLLAGALIALTMTSLTSVQAEYTTSKGWQGSSISIPLDDNRPATATDLNYPAASNMASADPMSMFNPNDPTLNMPVPLPEPILDGMPISPTPTGFEPGVPATPFVMPSQYSQGAAPLPYVFSSGKAEDSARAAMCLTTAIYYEAASESDAGQQAVAQVILNRVRHPAWPSTVCGVVYQGSDRPGCQFSFACDGSMARRPEASQWARASRHARAALAGYTFSPVGLATFYHTPAVNPSWNKRLIVSAVIGNHIFYRMPGSSGELRSFYGRYAGGEPAPYPKPRAYTPPKPLAPGMASLGIPFDQKAFNQGKAGPVPYPAAPSYTAPAYPNASAPVPMPYGQAKGKATLAPAAKRPSYTPEAESNYLPEAVGNSGDINPKYQNSGTWIK
jgi:hypothetical protein